MKNIYLYLIFTLMSFSVIAQVKITSMGDPVSTPHPSALLDVQSTDKGLLLPRLTHAQMLGISSPAEGLAIYNTDEKCVFIRTNTIWKSMCRSLGDIQTFVTTGAISGNHTDALDNIIATIAIPAYNNADRTIVLMGTIPWRYTNNTAFATTEGRDYTAIEVLEGATLVYEKRVWNGHAGIVKGTNWNQTQNYQSYWMQFLIPAGKAYTFRINKSFGTSSGTTGAFEIFASTGTYYIIKNY